MISSQLNAVGISDGDATTKLMHGETCWIHIYHLKMREDAYGIRIFVVPLMACSCRLELHTEVLKVETWDEFAIP